MKNILIITLLFLVSSCNLLKNVDKKQEDINFKEQIRTKSVRKGDTVTFFVPNIKLKDTTIYTVNHVGTRIETRYDDQGYIDRVDCISSAIEQFTEINRELVQELREKKKEESVDTNLNWTWIGIALILVAGFIVFKKI